MKMILPVFAGVLLGAFVSLEFAVWDRWSPRHDSNKPISGAANPEAADQQLRTAQHLINSSANEQTQPSSPEFRDETFLPVKRSQPAEPSQPSAASKSTPLLTAEEDLREKLVPAPTIDLTESAQSNEASDDISEIGNEATSSWSIWTGFRSRRSAQGFADHLAEFSNHDRQLFAAQPAGIGRWDVVYHYTDLQQKSALQQALRPLLGQTNAVPAGPQ